MKNKIFMNLTLVLFILGTYLAFPQSDYEIVQNFKNRIEKIELQIKDADTLTAIKEVEVSIDKLKSDFISYKELLDRSLYPDNFDLTLNKLRNNSALRQKDFTQIEVLHTEVVELKVEVDTLSRRNNELIIQFEDLEKQTSQRIEQLERDIDRLNASLKKRDEVVMKMIDSLLPQSIRNGENLSAAEKEQLYSDTEEGNVLYHIKRAVNDNIRFLNATRLQSKDIEDLRSRQQNFFRIWRSVGPTLVELYSTNGKSISELKEIDEAFSRWHTALDGEVWESIRTEFARNNIKLQNFTTGEEFTSVVTNYINDEILNSDLKGNEAEVTYSKFVDSAWYDRIKPEWVPFLIDNQMLTEEEKDSIEVLMASWKDTVYPDGINWLYIIIAVLVIAVLFLFFTRRKLQKGETSVNS